MSNRRPASADFSRNSVVLYSVPHQNEHTLVRNYKRVLPSNNTQ